MHSAKSTNLLVTSIDKRMLSKYSTKVEMTKQEKEERDFSDKKVRCFDALSILIL